MKAHRFFAFLGGVQFIVGTVVVLTGGDPTRAYALSACMWAMAIYRRLES